MNISILNLFFFTFFFIIIIKNALFGSSSWMSHRTFIESSAVTTAFWLDQYGGRFASIFRRCPLSMYWGQWFVSLYKIVSINCFVALRIGSCIIVHWAPSKGKGMPWTLQDIWLLLLTTECTALWSILKNKTKQKQKQKQNKAKPPFDEDCLLGKILFWRHY